ncbi:MAG: phage major capsid protein [Dehalococcoidia bacterium]
MASSASRLRYTEFTEQHEARAPFCGQVTAERRSFMPPSRPRTRTRPDTQQTAWNARASAPAVTGRLASEFAKIEARRSADADDRRARSEAAAVEAAMTIGAIRGDRVRDLARRGFDAVDGQLAFEGVPLGYDLRVCSDATADELGMSAREAAAIRATLQPAYETAFANWFHGAVALGSTSERARAALPDRERLALAAGTAEGGGYLLPPALLAEVLSARAAVSVVRPSVRAIPTSGAFLDLPIAQEDETDPTQYANAFRARWVGETEQVAYDDALAFGLARIPLRKLRSAIKVPGDLLSDSEGLLPWLAGTGGENLGAAEDAGFLTGDGTGNAPVGIVPQFAGATDDVEGSTSDTISNTVSTAGSAPKILAMQSALPAQYRRAARWIMRSSTELAVRKLVDANGAFHWPRRDNTLSGDPIDLSDAIAADGTGGSRVIVYGDLGAAAVIAERPGVSLVIDDRNLIREDQVVVYLKSRSGIGLYNSRAIRIGVV